MSKNDNNTAGGGLVLVTGAAGPLGCAIATEFAKEGRDLLLHDSVPSEETQAHLKVTHPGVSVSSVAGDILDPAFAGTLFDALGARRIRVLAHAGVAPPSTDPKRQQAFEVSFTATRRLVETLQPRMERGGVIILVASHRGTLIKNPLVDFGARRQARGSWSPTVWLLSKSQDTSFAVSQRCIQLYVKHKAAELSPLGVRIVSVSPGLVASTDPEATGEAPESTQTPSPSESAPVTRSSRPRDIAPVLTFLASPGAAYITGTDILVDGGLASRRRGGTSHMPKGLTQISGGKSIERNRIVRKKSQLSIPAPAGPLQNYVQGDKSTREVVDKEEVAKVEGDQGAIDEKKEPNQVKDKDKGVIEEGGPSDVGHDNEDDAEGKEAAGPADAVSATVGINASNAQPKEGPDTWPDPSIVARPSSSRRIRSSLDSVRVRLDKIQREGLGSQRRSGRGEAHATGQRARPQPGSGGGSDSQSLSRKPLPARPKTGKPDTQQESVKPQKQGNTAVDDGQQHDVGSSGLRSVVVIVRSKLEDVQQEVLHSIRNRDTTRPDTENAEDAEGPRSRMSSVGSISARLKKLQEKHAARAKAASTGPTHGSAGVVQSEAKTTDESHLNDTRTGEVRADRPDEKIEETGLSGTDNETKEAGPKEPGAEAAEAAEAAQASFETQPTTTEVKEV